MNPPETCPHCGAKAHPATAGIDETTFTCGTAWHAPNGDGEPFTIRAHECLRRALSGENETLRSTLRDCLPYLSTRRSVGEIEARERALEALGVQSEPVETSH